MALSSHSLDDTHAIAAVLAATIRVGDVVLLSGEMGAGKTAFVQGVAAALGVDEPVTSPTFTLVHSYNSGRVAVHHVDLYRLDRVGEIEDLALGELADTGALLIEWGEAAANTVGSHLHLQLGPVDPLKPERRPIVMHPVGPQWATRWGTLCSGLSQWRVGR